MVIVAVCYVYGSCQCRYLFRSYIDVVVLVLDVVVVIVVVGNFVAFVTIIVMIDSVIVFVVIVAIIVVVVIVVVIIVTIIVVDIQVKKQECTDRVGDISSLFRRHCQTNETTSKQ